ncbi:tripartite tricarboxylate transporter TctB family protein [Sporosarcina aquimarina]|uniref:tripartite tricarboxylate transporter TctB family protein n=1 Tax=Sporosarcina aquimarina TaxID=114975 RepID=UPI001FE3BBA7|nr:tripartite tricarboxylate transporter TctB family protein [Sporosarcina aquimarina]
MKVPHITSGIISICLGGLFYYLTLDFPKLNTADTGAAFLPRIYCGLLILFGIILLIQGIRDHSKNEESSQTVRYALISMVIVLAYILVIPYIGFYVSTALTIFSLLFFSKVRKAVTLVSVPLGAVLFVFLVFEKLLKVSIPMGSLFL